MSNFDRFQAPGYGVFDKHVEDLPVCENCGDECAIGLDESIYVKDEDIHFCSVDCLCRFDEAFTVQQLGGSFV